MICADKILRRRCDRNCQLPNDCVLVMLSRSCSAMLGHTTESDVSIIFMCGFCGRCNSVQI